MFAFGLAEGEGITAVILQFLLAPFLFGRKAHALELASRFYHAHYINICTPRYIWQFSLNML